MQPANITLNPSLENKNDTELVLKEMVAALSPLMQVEQSGLDIANTTTHYGAEIAKMEGFSRVLWGLFPLIHGGGAVSSGSFSFKAFVVVRIPIIQPIGEILMTTISDVLKWRSMVLVLRY